MLVLLCVLLILWIGGYLGDPGGDDLLWTPSGGSETTMTLPTSSGKHDPRNTEEEGTPTEPNTGDNEKSKGAMRASDSDMTESRKVHEPSRRRRQRRVITELADDICLYTHHRDHDDLANYDTPGEDRASLARSKNRHCDVVIRCCYYLEDDMTLQIGVSRARHRTPKHTYPRIFSAKRLRYSADHHRRSQRALVAVRARGSAIRILLGLGGQRATNAFVRNVLHVARSGHYSGVRLWWGEGDSGRIIQPGFVRAVRDLTAALRKANCTLGFFLPYTDRLHRVAYAARLRLLEGAFGSPQSLLLYPTTDFLSQNSLSNWKSPSQIVATSGDRYRAGASSTSSVCYLFLSATAISVALSNSTTFCNDVAKGVSTKSVFLSRKALSRLCRSRNSSWEVSSNLYYSIACRLSERDGSGGGNKEAVIFQTPLQALMFRRELLAHGRSSCFGFVDGERGFPRACQFTPFSPASL
ncbi:hypothetical protein V5799_032108 [Amblyomma americanum]|uniref:GH18 domain-containing protein n=1 Tax=Amblyomma americanum TaxID=6943 RepID=A0AAQ4DS32_AMBAM